MGVFIGLFEMFFHEVQWFIIKVININMAGYILNLYSHKDSILL